MNIKERFLKQFDEPRKDGQFAFVKVDKRLMKAYQYLSGFDADAVLVYLLIVDLYNESFGYAFPTLYNISIQLNMKNHRRDKALKTLEKYGLIETWKMDSGNKVYIPKEPLPLKEFVNQYPEALSNYEKLLKQIDGQRERDKKKKQKKRNKKQQEQTQQRRKKKVPKPTTKKEVVELLYQDGVFSPNNDAITEVIKVYPELEPWINEIIEERILM